MSYDEPPMAGAPSRETHPIRGVLYGLLLGLGLTILAVVTRVVVLAWLPMIFVLVLGTAIGLAWSLFGPAKKPKLQA